MIPLVAWIPFLQPLTGLHSAWHLLAIPLVIGVSMVYKGVRLPEHDAWTRAWCIMTVQVLLALIALGVAVALLVRGVLPVLST